MTSVRDRILLSGMGGELGVRLANLLAADPNVDVRGLDLDPPRRRTADHIDFVRVDPRDRDKTVRSVREFEPTTVIHLGVYEPNARTGPNLAKVLNEIGSLHLLGAAAECPSLRHLVVRSGIEVYGRRRGQASCPDESVVPDPTSPFGRQLLRIEELADGAARAAGAVCTVLRLAPVTGAAMASPLARYFRLPVVPVSPFTDLPFSLLHQTDAATALAAAVGVELHGPVNVVGAGAVAPLQAVRMGGRLPMPVAGPQWAFARLGAEVFGAPLPHHLRELLVRGRSADGTAAAGLLGVTPAWTTPEVVRDIYDWEPVAHVVPGAAGLATADAA